MSIRKVCGYQGSAGVSAEVSVGFILFWDFFFSSQLVFLFCIREKLSLRTTDVRTKRRSRERRPGRAVFVGRGTHAHAHAYRIYIVTSSVGDEGWGRAGTISRIFPDCQTRGSGNSVTWPLVFGTR